MRTDTAAASQELSKQLGRRKHHIKAINPTLIEPTIKVIARPPNEYALRLLVANLPQIIIVTHDNECVESTAVVPVISFAKEDILHPTVFSERLSKLQSCKVITGHCVCACLSHRKTHAKRRRTEYSISRQNASAVVTTQLGPKLAP